MIIFFFFSKKEKPFFCRDDITGQISKKIFSGFTSGENLGGLKLFRGYEAVEEKFISKKPRSVVIDDYTDGEQTPEARRRALERKRQLQETEDYDNEVSGEIREIDHLILVIHG